MPSSRDDSGQTEAGGGAMPRHEEFGFGRPFDSVPECMLLLDERGRIVLWNRSAARILGYSPEEAVGQDAADLVALELRISPVAQEPTEPFEIAATSRDGAALVLDTTLTRYPHEGKSYTLAIMRDVTRRVGERKAREARVSELQDAVESLEAFAHVIAHDLKEPVRGMATYLDELESDPDAPDRRQMILRAAEANRNLRRLLDGLLEWSRTTTTALDPKPQRLHEVLRDPGCAAQWENLQRERNAKLDIATDIPPIFGTEALVCRVFGNLITNAIRHNPRSAPGVWIRAGAVRRGKVEVLVEDDGPGFPDTLVRRARSPTQRPATLKGGFGLTITRRAVERLGGAMSITNAPDGGGIVHVLLPAAEGRSSLEQRVRELV